MANLYSKWRQTNMAVIMFTIINSMVLFNVNTGVYKVPSLDYM